jgi:hypothetical protein
VRTDSTTKTNFTVKKFFFCADVLALAASIGELTAHTRRARTANWCALQMADRENPRLTCVCDLDLDDPVKLRPYTNPSAEEATAASGATNVLSSPSLLSPADNATSAAANPSPLVSSCLTPASAQAMFGIAMETKLL